MAAFRHDRVNIDRILSERTLSRIEWTPRDTILYAHGIGLARDPLDAVELQYLDEIAPVVFPTFLVSAALRGGPLANAAIDRRRALHGEHALTLHAPVPANGVASVEGRILGVWDKGVDKGAVFLEEKQVRAVDGSVLLATIRSTVFARGDGGMGGARHGQPAPHRPPERAPDRYADIETAPNLALLYRLSGDHNPIHFSPLAAVEAGFEQPILHGLCTFALCARVAVNAFANRSATRLHHIQARFSAPVYPGETLRISLWKDKDIISFSASVPSRNTIVIEAGKIILSLE